MNFEHDGEFVLSPAAVDLCARWFLNGERSRVRAYPDNPTLNDRRAALDELLLAGLVTERRHGDGALAFKGSDEAGAVGRKRALELGFSDLEIKAIAPAPLRWFLGLDEVASANESNRLKASGLTEGAELDEITWVRLRLGLIAREPLPESTT